MNTADVASSVITFPLTTLLVVEELWGGDSLVYPVADLSLVSAGSLADGFAEQRLFLSEYLALASADIVAKFAIPEGTTLRNIGVELTREGLPSRLESHLQVTMPCVMIPAGKDAWVVILPLRHTLYVSEGEDIDVAVRAEVMRMASVLQSSSFDMQRLLPARQVSLAPMSIEVERIERAPAGRAMALRKQLREQQKRAEAVEVLASVAQAMHRPDVSVPPIEGRDAELKLLGTLLSGPERLSVALLGEELVGKSALFRSWLAREKSEGREPLVYATSGAQLIAGMSGLGQWQERLRRVLEATHQLDAILYFENLGDLFTASADGGLDPIAVIKPFLDEGKIRLVGELRGESVEIAERRHGGFFAALSRIALEPLSADAARRALFARIAHDAVAEPERVRLLVDAVEPLIDLASRYQPYRAFPGKAIRLYEDLRRVHDKQRTDSGEPISLGRRQLYDFFSLSTGIPTFLLREDRALDIADVIEFLQRRVVGQTEAMRRVAETVSVIKAGLQPQEKPLATFLFVGPTGVGKTELARTLAEYLFGNGDRMLRFDMSEYMDASAASRLINGTDRAEGILTRKVREQPFCVLLLDEVEKASPAVFDLLLQVCGEGRLTDVRGKTAFFHNAIIIMTSNLGAAHKRPTGGFLSSREDSETYYRKQVMQSFRPEFVNRIDRIIAFAALSERDAQHIVDIAIGKLAQRRGFIEYGIEIDVAADVRLALAKDGYSERYGARALRRHLEERLVAPVARLVSGMGSAARELSVVVRRADASAVEPDASPALVQHGLAFSVQKRSVKETAAASDEMTEISTISDQARRFMRSERVEQVRAQIEYLAAQLNIGKRIDADLRGAKDVGALQTEHHRLQAPYARVSSLAHDIEAIEELALMALLDGERVTDMFTEANALSNTFETALVPLLLSMDRRHDACALLLQELDDHGALMLYLQGFGAACKARGWDAEVHVFNHQDPRASHWPSHRRWGPPMPVQAVMTLLPTLNREPNSILLRVSGPFAGSMLAFEATGRHVWTGKRVSHGRATLHCRFITTRTLLAQEEWSSEELQPQLPTRLDELERAARIRTVYLDLGHCIAHPGYLNVAPEQLWSHLEKFVLARYRSYEQYHDVDDLFVGAIERKVTA